MLRELAVQNLALIEDVRVELQPGFCAWTGETGAGKTLLLSALGLLLGERGNADLLREGTEELRIVGRFELTRPEQRRAISALLDQPPEDEQIVLMRRLGRAGRSSAYVNEQPVSVGTLRSIGNLLVAIHGQRESMALLEPAYQLRLLDAFGSLDKLRQRYEESAAQVRGLRQRRTALIAARQQRQRDLALLRFQRDELDEAALQAGELAELAQVRQRLTHAQALATFGDEALAKLHDDDASLHDQLGKLQRQAEHWSGVEPHLVEVALRLQGLCSELQEVAALLRGQRERWQADPRRQDEVEDRLQLLKKLEVKYGQSIEALIAYHATLGAQEAQLQQAEDELSSLDEQLAKAFVEAKQAAAALSKARKQVAGKLATAVQKHLADLGMSDARLEAVLEPLPLGDDAAASELPAQGLEQLELHLAANPGEPARPLRKVASGGELSRTMLALKSVLAGQDHVGTLIFDEIDANVGGRLGDVLGEKLAALGKTHQVICVTHLPQVASYAPQQWTIRKHKRGQRTSTTIELLSEKERLDELASMLRGSARGETTRREAEAMLKAARRSWGG